MNTDIFLYDIRYIIASIVISISVAELMLPEKIRKTGYVIGGMAVGYFSLWFFDWRSWFNVNYTSTVLTRSLELLKMLIAVFLYYFIIKETLKNIHEAHDQA
ncbi:MAG: hypothetical protein GXO24_01410 [Chlorobi bacterium]|nr:hypothetical protein [Chlorobiota bacterium]